MTKRRPRGTAIRSATIVGLAGGLLLLLAVAPATAQEVDDNATEQAVELAERYAPIMVLKAQSGIGARSHRFRCDGPGRRVRFFERRPPSSDSAGSRSRYSPPSTSRSPSLSAFSQVWSVRYR